MRSYAFGLLALAASAVAAPQAVTAVISPSAPAPSGCASSYSGQFEITVVNVTKSASAKAKRAALEITLANGILKDAQGRTGYIASNYQFQFDGPPQAGAIYTAGFSVCGNGSLALGGSAIWYQCYSGGFYNLYDRSWAAQCTPIYIDVIGASVSTAAATQAADGQPAVTTQVTQRTDGQVYATTVAVSQISDGQIQAGNPVSQISDGQIQAPKSTAAAVSQISDGQVQAGTKSAAAVSQISDGQVQAPKSTAAPVSQISDGQVQAPKSTAAPVSQISDGQVQAPNSTAAPVSQISDGQIQAPTSSAKPVSQISDGQVQAGTSSVVVAVASATSSAPAQVTVNAAPQHMAGEGVAVVAGLAAAFALL